MDHTPHIGVGDELSVGEIYERKRLEVACWRREDVHLDIVYSMKVRRVELLGGNDQAARF